MTLTYILAIIQIIQAKDVKFCAEGINVVDDSRVIERSTHIYEELYQLLFKEWIGIHISIILVVVAVNYSP